MTPGQFENLVKNPDLPVITDLSYPGKTILIAISGIAGALGIPPFEFFNLTSPIEVNKIYLRDLDQAWYHAGLRGISGSIDETASFLRRKIEESGAKKVVLFGNSMGGYAALLFGFLLNADLVHAFAPHTRITRLEHVRNKKQLRKVHETYPEKYFDLKEAAGSHPFSGKFHLYYFTQDKLDKSHALHVQDEPNFILHASEGYGHALIKELKKTGELRNIIISSLTPARDGCGRGHGKRRGTNLIDWVRR